MTDGHFVMIPLTQGKFAIVDEDDYPLVGHYKWQAEKACQTWYAKRREYPSRRTVRMHAVIAGCDRPDHANGNGLDNRRINLRPATESQNRMNQRLRSDNTSGFKGVSWDKRRSTWQAHIRIDGRSTYLGSFLEIIDAALAYDKAAVKAFGQFARLNFPEEPDA